MAEVLSVAASITAIVHVSGIVINYLHAVKGASSEREDYKIETFMLNAQLLKLENLLNNTSSTSPWFTGVLELKVPLEQYKTALESLEKKVAQTSKLRKVGTVLLWSLVQEDIARILGRIGRLQNVVTIALTQDHMSVYFHCNPHSPFTNV